MALSKNNVVRFRLSDLEYDYIKSQVDYFNYDSVSDYLRSLVRREIEEERKGDDIVRLSRS